MRTHTPSSTPVSPPLPTDPEAFLRHLFDVAVRRALPLENMRTMLPPVPQGGRTWVIGAGKAAGAMAQALEQLWPADAHLAGAVVTRYGHTPPRPTALDGQPPRIDILEASHPVPDEAGLAAAERMLAIAQAAQAGDLVICLMSGGGSALLTAPAAGLTLADKQRLNQALLDSGAGIGDMNCVRKHLSQIKGGRLGLACAPAQLVTLAISDVPGDDVGVIASGPTVPDRTTCADAVAILERLNIDLPAPVWAALRDGSLESPKPDHPVWATHQVNLIATPRDALQAAASVVNAAGLPAYILSDDLEGESREVGRVHAALATGAATGVGRTKPQDFSAFKVPCVILSGGETTVTIKKHPPERGLAKGRGGRAAEFCMGLAQALNGHAGIWGLAADTDGIDGIEHNAGALVTPSTLTRAAAAGVSLSDCLTRNDGFGFFNATGDLVVTGPTHTNVNDFRAILVIPDSASVE